MLADTRGLRHNPAVVQVRVAVFGLRVVVVVAVFDLTIHQLTRELGEQSARVVAVLTHILWLEEPLQI